MGRDGSDHGGQKERRNEGVLQRSLTDDRISSWSDQKLEKMIKRNSVVKDNEDHVREVHAISRKKSSNSRPMDCPLQSLIRVFFPFWPLPSGFQKDARPSL